MFRLLTEADKSVFTQFEFISLFLRTLGFNGYASPGLVNRGCK